MGRDAPVGESEAEAARAARWEDLPFIEQMLTAACGDVISMRGGKEFLLDLVEELGSVGVPGDTSSEDGDSEGICLDRLIHVFMDAAKGLLQAEGPLVVPASLMVGTFQGVPVGVLGIRMLLSRQSPARSQGARAFLGSSRPARLIGPWVEPEARELGVGSALVSQARSWARERGADALEAVVLPGDRLSKQLYEAGHCVARALVMRGPVDA
jgi:GNAT superfamily N-acetyltransferase